MALPIAFISAVNIVEFGGSKPELTPVKQSLKLYAVISLILELFLYFCLIPLNVDCSSCI